MSRRYKRKHFQMRHYDAARILKGVKQVNEHKNFVPILIERYGDKCLCCGEKKRLTLDHIKPRSLGGKTVLSNLQLLCTDCNNNKADKEIDYRQLNLDEVRENNGR